MGPGLSHSGCGRIVNMSSDIAALPGTWDPGEAPAKVTILYDGTDVALVQFEITTLTGKVIKVEAAPKNPNETLPPTTTAAPPGPTTSTTSTTSTTVANQPPTANAMTIFVNDNAPITFTLDGHDPENGALTGMVTPASVPAGPPPWDVSVTGLSVTLTAYGTPGTATLTYQVTDPLGAPSALANITVNLIATPTSTTTTTTSTTTTTTTTRPPPPRFPAS